MIHVSATTLHKHTHRNSSQVYAVPQSFLSCRKTHYTGVDLCFLSPQPNTLMHRTARKTERLITNRKTQTLSDDTKIIELAL